MPQITAHEREQKKSTKIAPKIVEKNLQILGGDQVELDIDFWIKSWRLITSHTWQIKG